MARRKKSVGRAEKAKQHTYMANPTSVTVTFTPTVGAVVNLDDGSTQTLTSQPTVGPTDTEIDIVKSDGSVVKVPIPQS